MFEVKDGRLLGGKCIYQLLQLTEIRYVLLWRACSVLQCAHPRDCESCWVDSESANCHRDLAIRFLGIRYE